MLYFKAEEFDCKCSYPDCDAPHIDLKFLALADTLRARWGKPLVVNSGTRCRRHNEAVGGSPLSQHCLGMAADFRTSDRAESALLAKLGRDLGFGGVGIYETWVHLDLGPKRDWEI